MLEGDTAQGRPVVAGRPRLGMRHRTGFMLAGDAGGGLSYPAYRGTRLTDDDSDGLQADLDRMSEAPGWASSGAL